MKNEFTESVKVPKEEFERVIKALLNTKPTPMADITRKRPKALKHAGNKP